MIKLLEIKNFKSIKKHYFPLRNLNVILGLNGMGKSTLIQSFLLLRQSNNLHNGFLRLNGDHVELGKGQDVYYQFNKEEVLVFNITFTDNQKGNFTFAYNSEADNLKTVEEAYFTQSFYQHSIFNSKFQYLSASRIDPKSIHDKSYTKVIEEKNLGDKGEFTSHFLSVYGGDEITFLNLRHTKSTSNLLKEQVNRWMGEISPGIRLNVEEIANADKILLDVQYEQPSRGLTNKFKPVNVGFGISYALPVVTALLSAEPGKLLIIENPESHIHPRGQAELGRLIALTAMNDVQIIVETHSDHLLNGIRVATKELAEKDKNTTDKIVLFYFEKEVRQDEQYSKITNIEIDRNGELSRYPPNLLEEWSNQLMKLI